MAVAWAPPVGANGQRLPHGLGWFMQSYNGEYGLRPYFVGGAGLMLVRIDHPFGVLPVAKTSPALDVGGGVLGFITNRIGVCWDVRRFASLSRTTEQGLSIGTERLSFWRASMSLAIRY